MLIHHCTLISRVASFFFSHHGKIRDSYRFLKGRSLQSLLYSPLRSPRFGFDLQIFEWRPLFSLEKGYDFSFKFQEQIGFC